MAKTINKRVLLLALTPENKLKITASPNLAKKTQIKMCIAAVQYIITKFQKKD